MTAICANANLTERYFYESFRNRDELLVTVIDGIADEIRTVTLAAMEAADGDPREQIRAGIDAFIIATVRHASEGLPFVVVNKLRFVLIWNFILKFEKNV